MVYSDTLLADIANAAYGLPTRFDGALPKLRRRSPLIDRLAQAERLARRHDSLSASAEEEALVTGWLRFFEALQGPLERLLSPNRGLFDASPDVVRKQALLAHCKGQGASAAAQLRPAVKALSQQLQSQRLFLLGDRQTLADVCGAAALCDVVDLLPMACLGDCGAVQQWLSRCLALLPPPLGRPPLPDPLLSGTALEAFVAAVDEASNSLGCLHPPPLPGESEPLAPFAVPPLPVPSKARPQTPQAPRSLANFVSEVTVLQAARPESSVMKNLDPWLAAIVASAQPEGHTHRPSLTEAGLELESPERLLAIELEDECDMARGAWSCDHWWDVEIIAESSNFVALMKPAGMFVVSDLQGQPTVTDFIHVAQRCAKLPDQEAQPQRGICNALESDISGPQVLARNVEAFEHYMRESANHQVRNEYVALVEGLVEPLEGVINVPLKSFQEPPRKVSSRTCLSEGQVAVTKYRVLRQWCVSDRTDGTRFWGRTRSFSLLQIRTLTSRPHQIRAHMACIGHPLVCDQKFNARNYEQDFALSPRIFLHCLRTEFRDVDGKLFSALLDLSPDLEAALARIRDLSAEPPVIATSRGFLGLQAFLNCSGDAKPRRTQSSPTALPSYYHCTACGSREALKVSILRHNGAEAASWTLECCDDLPTRNTDPNGSEGPSSMGPWGVGSRWVWAHDGFTPNGWISFEAGGQLETRWGLGTWRLLACDTMLVTFGAVEHALRLSGASPRFDVVRKRSVNGEQEESAVSYAQPASAPSCCPTKGWLQRS